MSRAVHICPEELYSSHCPFSRRTFYVGGQMFIVCVAKYVLYVLQSRNFVLFRIVIMGFL